MRRLIRRFYVMTLFEVKSSVRTLGNAESDGLIIILPFKVDIIFADDFSGEDNVLTRERVFLLVRQHDKRLRKVDKTRTLACRVKSVPFECSPQRQTSCPEISNAHNTGDYPNHASNEDNRPVISMGFEAYPSCPDQDFWGKFVHVRPRKKCRGTNDTFLAIESGAKKAFKKYFYSSVLKRNIEACLFRTVASRASTSIRCASKQRRGWPEQVRP